MKWTTRLACTVLLRAHGLAFNGPRLDLGPVALDHAFEAWSVSIAQAPISH